MDEFTENSESNLTTTNLSCGLDQCFPRLSDRKESYRYMLKIQILRLLLL